MGQIAAEFASSKTAIRNALIVFKIPRVIEHEGEQKIIRSVLEMKAQGFSNSTIAHAPQAMKISTKKRGKRWHPETVRQILVRAKSKT